MLWVILFLILLSFLYYHRVSLLSSSIFFGLTLAAISYIRLFNTYALVTLWIIFSIITIVLLVKPLRRYLITQHVFKIFKRHCPQISETEKLALEAGTIGWEGQLFTGKPNWRVLTALPYAALSQEEHDFIAGPVQQLCAMSNDWHISQIDANLPPEIWKFIKENNFFGLIIPKKYGGKEFSAYAHSQIIMILSSCSPILGTTVSVPNSLGPAELLIQYGTEQQRDYYLPRLAKGEEIPCFALTSVHAGSDASSITDTGIVCRDEFDGTSIIGIRINFSKRYITLGPIATLIGLAFQLKDPDALLGEIADIGISCALIPINTPGIIHGRRHFPLNAALQNGPLQGNDVFIPLDWLIGGTRMMGQGWRMLIECLSVGRAISLPAIALAGAKMASLSSGAYCRIRKQFGIPLGHFEGIQEKLALIGGLTYIMDATRMLTLSTILSHEKPAVESAILKYHLTEMGRQIIQAAMDVHGGKAICLGPKNYLGQAYLSLPITITVEGANILTRCMIIFGQGLIRCHPHVLSEISSVNITDAHAALIKFDKHLFGHIGLIGSNKVRALWLGLTNGHLSLAPQGPLKRYYQGITRFSAAFVYLTDVSLLLFGDKLKRMESISGRFADILSMLFIGSAILKRLQHNKVSQEELPLVHWASQYVLFTIETKMHEILINYPNKWIAWCLRQLIIFPLGRRCAPPKDHLNKQVAQLLLEPSKTRNQLCQGVFLNAYNDRENVFALLEKTLSSVIKTQHLELRVAKALAEKKINHSIHVLEQYEFAKQANIISEREYEQLLDCHTLRLEILQVDDFASDAFKRNEML